MTLENCEETFLKNNLALLAQQYNVSLSDADIAQAKIWDLPYASIESNIYNPQNKKVFDVTNSKSVQIQQLLLLGGKRKSEIEFLKSNKELSQLQFQQLLADLKAQLRENFYSLYFEQKKVENIEVQLKYLNELLNAYKVQTNKGNTSLRDQVRLQSMVMALNSDKISANNNILGFEQNLKLLTGISEEILPDLSEAEVKDLLAFQPLQNADEIQKKAFENNADYLSSLKMIDNNKLYMNWQKSLNVPDLTVGGVYNQGGGTFKNEVDFTVGIPIPLWKRNAGNIQKAQVQIDQSTKYAELKKLTLQIQISQAYQTWQNQYNMLNSVQQKDVENLETVYKGVLDNFHKGNVTLIEFTDFMDSYRQSVSQIYEMKKQVLISAEEINHLTQTKIF